MDKRISETIDKLLDMYNTMKYLEEKTGEKKYSLFAKDILKSLENKEYTICLNKYSKYMGEE